MFGGRVLLDRESGFSNPFLRFRLDASKVHNRLCRLILSHTFVFLQKGPGVAVRTARQAFILTCFYLNAKTRIFFVVKRAKAMQLIALWF
ncbi:hypothetical protein SDC9_142996 [bioreactor metagenome]|uniref:Uncharacterized protein n=1 Tax=bioreactor metagenome TaxID=1076179 RepID=A0A645E2R2_9ZZZZ